MTPYVIDEFGCALPVVVALFAAFVWMRYKGASLEPER
jgi:hypothetical protein